MENWVSHNMHGMLGNSVVRTTFSYTTDNPYAISIAMAVTGQSPVTWLMGRELFLDVLKSTDDETVGEGDVTLCLRNGVITVTLGPKPDKRVTIVYPANLVSRFLDLTLEMVPAGYESDALRIPDTLDAMFPTHRME
jgi:hypothetical protein